VTSRRALWALLGGLAGFVVLAAAYDNDPVATIDRRVAERLADGLPGFVESVAIAVSWLGGTTGLIILGTLLTAMLVRERAWVDLAFLVAAFVGSQLAVAQLKEAFERPRPTYGSVVPLPESFAFPSGHAGGGVAAFGAAAVLVSERLDSTRARTAVWVTAGILAAASGLSRIALNVHYVSDVLAGWCFGLAWLAACILVRDVVRRRVASRSR
jgi:undecaprenyl-diphosphatase